MECAVTVLEGTLPAIRFTFRDYDGVLADPGAITVRVLGPTGGPAEYDTPTPHIVKLSLGVWQFTFPDPPTPGTWRVYGAGTAGVIAAAETAVAVKAATVPPMPEEE